MKRVILPVIVFLLTACLPLSEGAPVTATQTSEVFETSEVLPTATVEVTVTPSPSPTPEAETELRPQTVGCLHLEDVETWCAGLEPKDPHGLWQNAIDALVDGPANADYWASMLGKTNHTHEEKLTWLAEHDYYLPASSPNGTEWVWIVGSPVYPMFKTNKVVTEAGGVSLANIRTVVILPNNWSQIKDWWREQIDAQRSSPPIVTSGSTAYSPGEIYGWLAVTSEETGLVEMVFVGGSSFIHDNAKQKGYDEVMIGGEGANEAAVFTAMWETFMRASKEFTEKDLDLRSGNHKTPDMGIVGAYTGYSHYPTDPTNLKEEEILFE